MRCVECEEPITNPLCPTCLAEGVEQWAHEEGNMILVREVRKLSAGFVPRGEVTCIKCRAPMDVCAYCYTKSVFALVREYPALLAHYLVYFNFDLEHLGWERDARALSRAEVD